MIPVFITARLGSERLPRKHLLKLGNCNVLQHVIRRCLHAGFETILCTTSNDEDKELIEVADEEGIPSFAGNPIDVCARWWDCAEEHDFWSFHALDGDDPYFDWQEVERSYSYLHDLKLYEVKPTISSDAHALGLMGTSLGTDAFNADKRTEKKHLPERRKERIIRATLDYPQDYWFLSALSQLGCGPTTPRLTMELAACNPLSEINCYLNKEWKDRQNAEKRSFAV